MSETIYVEPECIHDNWGGKCVRCGARKRWVVEKPIDYEAATRYAEDNPPTGALVTREQYRKSHARCVRGTVDAALGIGGDDEAK